MSKKPLISAAFYFSVIVKFYGDCVVELILLL